MQPCTEEAMMLNHNFTMMNEDESASTTKTPSKRMMRSTGPRSFGGMLARLGAGLLLLLLMAEGAVVMPEEAVAEGALLAEGALWSDPVSSSPGRQRRVVGAWVAEKAATEEGVVMTENGHDTTTSRRYDVAAAAGAVVTAQDGSHLHEFPRRHEMAEEDGIEMMEDGSRTHEFSTPRRVNIKNSKKSLTLAEEPVEEPVPGTGKYDCAYDPKCIYCSDDGTTCYDYCLADGSYCFYDCDAPPSCYSCCNGYHTGSWGLSTYCGPNPYCWGYGTECVPEVSCGKCCSSWHWHWWGGGYCG